MDEIQRSANTERSGLVLGPSELRAARDMLEIMVKEGSLRMMSTMLGLPWTKQVDNPSWASLVALCVSCENPKMLELILSSREDWSAVLEDGVAFTEAVRREQVECLELLAKAGADVDAMFEDGEPCLVRAVKSKWWASAEKLVDLGANVDPGRPGRLLIGVIEGCQLSLLGKLLDKGADPSNRPRVGMSPLEAMAMVYRHDDCAPAMMERLLMAGVDVDSAGPTGMTALMWAVSFDVAPMVARLLAAGADPWLVDREGEAALFRAASRGSDASAFVLLEAAPPKAQEDWVKLSDCASNHRMPNFSVAVAARLESFAIAASAAESDGDQKPSRILRM